jgi:hypothetical protein
LSLAASVFVGGVVTFKFLKGEFITRLEHKLLEQAVEQKIIANEKAFEQARAEDKEKRHEIRNLLQSHYMEHKQSEHRLSDLITHLQVVDERQRWVIKAVHAVAQQVGANGFPDPSELLDTSDKR